MADALTTRKQALLEDLGTRTAGQLRRIWLSLGDYAESDQEAWATLAAPVVEAAQGRAVNLQVAYLETLLDETVDFDIEDVLANAQIDIGEPFIALANALSNGEEITAAVESGALRAEGIGESGVTWAARAANGAVERNDRVTGWQRTLSRGACEWCQTVAGQTYRSAESASFGHLRCNCGVEPVIS